VTRLLRFPVMGRIRISAWPRRFAVLLMLAAALGSLALWLPGGGCAPPPPPGVSQPPAPPPAVWQERPGPDGPWRPALLQRCQGSDATSLPAERALAVCFDLFTAREGSDAIMGLELYLQEHAPDGLVLLALGQLYLMAGQGEPELLPREGPAADVGDWVRNRRRLLGRAEALLAEAGGQRPDDSVADYLLGDVARARGDTAAAHTAWERGLAKCSRPRSFDLLRDYQMLQPRAARLTASVAPDYPLEALQQGITGEVVLDLLVSPHGEVVQFVTVSSPDPALTAAAGQALLQARCEPARLGKYPLWSWLRVPTQFSLAP
jgi:TonB family protein